MSPGSRPPARVTNVARARAAPPPMLSRYAVPLLCAAAIVFACGPRPHAAESSVSTARAATTGAGAAATAATAARPDSSGAPRMSKKALAEDIARNPLASSLGVRVRGGAREVTFALLVTNRADKNVELLFPSGLTHDFVVRDAAGAEVWRWSEGRMYTQAVQSRLLGGNETTTYEETWTPGARSGRFTVAAELRSSSHVVRQEAAFVLP